MHVNRFVIQENRVFTCFFVIPLNNEPIRMYGIPGLCEVYAKLPRDIFEMVICQVYDTPNMNRIGIYQACPRYMRS